MNLDDRTFENDRSPTSPIRQQGKGELYRLLLSVPQAAAFKVETHQSEKEITFYNNRIEYRSMLSAKVLSSFFPFEIWNCRGHCRLDELRKQEEDTDGWLSLSEAGDVGIR